jgi:DnaJ-class molecular chaperone
MSRVRSADKLVKCYECKGTGRQQYLTGTPTGNVWDWWPCEHCNGMGMIVIDSVGRRRD